MGGERKDRRQEAPTAASRGGLARCVFLLRDVGSGLAKNQECLTVEEEGARTQGASGGRREDTQEGYLGQGTRYGVEPGTGWVLTMASSQWPRVSLGDSW